MGQEKTIEILGGWSSFFFKDKVKRIKNWLKNQTLLSIYQKKELELTLAFKKEGPVVSTSSRKVQRQAQRTSEEAEREKEEPIGTDFTHKGTGSAVDGIVNMARTLMEFTAKEQDKMKKTF
ncbi:hypothetical protein O181_110559 [Austropuccinia psidii MF-1]|uniref:Uncharacterized protein n=1 Tax=Austropuccinia psidii MF-1 TaxID=1389203 RepID=A0A9Q3PQX8_9BASI|nr:hypothetical protein [Austropuccinia psidii MF-1]